jgi:hypothetical protein
MDKPLATQQVANRNRYRGVSENLLLFICQPLLLNNQHQQQVGDKAHPATEETEQPD